LQRVFTRDRISAEAGSASLAPQTSRVAGREWAVSPARLFYRPSSGWSVEEDEAKSQIPVEYHHSGPTRSSDGGSESEVLTKGTHDVRKFDLLVEFAARISRVVCVVTAAFLVLGYGDGSSPSASSGDHDRHAFVLREGGLSWRHGSEGHRTVPFGGRLR